MENNNVFNQKTDDQTSKIGTDLENKEKLGELEEIPIFRNNDLYAEMFPEIHPTFEKGEEPTVKKIFDEIIKYQGKKIILDETCKSKIEYVEVVDCKIEDFPLVLELKELPLHPKNAEFVDMDRIFEILKEKLDITLVLKNSEGNPTSVDEKIGAVLGGTFSPELVKNLFEIAKQKNSNIKKVYILTGNIDDHIFTEDRDAVLPTVVPTLVDEAKKSFGVEPVVLPTMNGSQVQDGDFIIVDRHNALVRGGIVEQKPTQFSVLPLETELSNNERYLENKPSHTKLTTLLRKQFEKKTD